MSSHEFGFVIPPGTSVSEMGIDPEVDCRRTLPDSMYKDVVGRIYVFFFIVGYIIYNLLLHQHFLATHDVHTLLELADALTSEVVDDLFIFIVIVN